MSKRVNAGERIDRLTRHNRPIRVEDDVLARAFAPRQNALAAPQTNIFEAPYVCLVVNVEWVSHVIGVLETLNQPDAWQGDATERDRAQNEILRLMEQLIIGDACMVDPCCPETNEILTDIKVINQQIIDNMVTLINNQQTIINDNDTIISNQQIISNYTYQQVINQGNEYNFYLEMLDDGESPQSFAQGVSDNFSYDDLSNGWLCKAIENYINGICENIRAYLVLLGIVSAAAAAVFGIALVLTGGLAAALAPFIGAALGTLGTAAAYVLSTAINDEDAKRRVRCCMYNSLINQPINQANFAASVNDCGFDGNNTNDALAAQLAAFVNDINQRPGSYRAFVVELKNAQQSGVTGSVAPCDCGCNDDVELVPYGSNAANVQIIPMGNCVYRIISTNVVSTDNGGMHRAGFKDLLDRPLKVDYPPEGYPLQGIAGSTVSGACGQADYNGENFGGGFVPFAALSDVHWWTGNNTPIDTFMKITLVAPEDCNP